MDPKTVVFLQAKPYKDVMRYSRILPFTHSSLLPAYRHSFTTVLVILALRVLVLLLHC